MRRQELICKDARGPVRGVNNQQTDFTKMFQESQNNIMRLNQSRLNALAELKSARQRIADLGRPVNHTPRSKHVFKVDWLRMQSAQLLTTLIKM